MSLQETLNYLTEVSLQKTLNHLTERKDLHAVAASHKTHHHEHSVTPLPSSGAVTHKPRIGKYLIFSDRKDLRMTINNKWTINNLRDCHKKYGRHFPVVLALENLRHKKKIMSLRLILVS